MPRWRELTHERLLARGRALFEDLPRDAFVRWSGDLLETALALRPSTPVVASIVAATRDDDRWKDCRELFHEVRGHTLAAERTASRSPDPLLLPLLLLAENVAKATYNASGVQPQFDSDAGHWILVCAADVLRDLTDASQGLALERLLSRHATPET